MLWGQRRVFALINTPPTAAAHLHCSPRITFAIVVVYLFVLWNFAIEHLVSLFTVFICVFSQLLFSDQTLSI